MSDHFGAGIEIFTDKHFDSPAALFFVFLVPGFISVLTNPPLPGILIPPFLPGHKNVIAVITYMLSLYVRRQCI